MIDVSIDHNMEGHASVLRTVLPEEEWNAFGVGTFLRLTEAGLDSSSSDRDIWRWIQQNRLLLLTGNRTGNDPDSLELTWRDELSSTSMPVITVANLRRIFADKDYRYECAICLADVAMTLDKHLGTGRVWIPY